MYGIPGLGSTQPGEEPAPLPAAPSLDPTSAVAPPTTDARTQPEMEEAGTGGDATHDGREDEAAGDTSPTKQDVTQVIQAPADTEDSAMTDAPVSAAAPTVEVASLEKNGFQAQQAEDPAGKDDAADSWMSSLDAALEQRLLSLQGGAGPAPPSLTQETKPDAQQPDTQSSIQPDAQPIPQSNAQPSTQPDAKQEAQQGPQEDTHMDTLPDGQPESARTAQTAQIAQTAQTTQEPDDGGEGVDWEADSSPYESSDSSDSSDSESDDGDYAPMSIEETARLLMEMEDGDDADGGKAGKVDRIRSKNEAEEEAPPIPDVQIAPDAPLSRLGKVLHTFDKTVVVEAFTDGPVRPFDLGSIVCNEERAVVGVVADVIGQVHAPLYMLLYQNPEEIGERGIKADMTLYCPEEHAKYILTEALKNIKGSDASNIHDEEANDEDVEFSDDEKEREWKRQNKLKRQAPKGDDQGQQQPQQQQQQQKSQSQGRRGGDRANRGGRDGPHPLSQEIRPGSKDGLSYDDSNNSNGAVEEDDDGPYRPLARPADYGMPSFMQHQPTRGRGLGRGGGGGGFGRDRGGQHGRGGRSGAHGSGNRDRRPWERDNHRRPRGGGGDGRHIHDGTHESSDRKPSQQQQPQQQQPQHPHHHYAPQHAPQHPPQHNNNNDYHQQQQPARQQQQYHQTHQPQPQPQFSPRSSTTTAFQAPSAPQFTAPQFNFSGMPQMPTGPFSAPGFQVPPFSPQQPPAPSRQAPQYPPHHQAHAQFPQPQQQQQTQQFSQQFPQSQQQTQQFPQQQAMQFPQQQYPQAQGQGQFGTNGAYVNPAFLASLLNQLRGQAQGNGQPQ